MLEFFMDDQDQSEVNSEIFSVHGVGADAVITVLEQESS
jgi:hypothetical protein